MGAEAEQTSTDIAALRSPWNSLEIARIVMSAATPLALFALGFLVSQQAKHETEVENRAKLEREADAAKNRAEYEKQIRNERAAREEEAQRAATDLQLRLRDLADRREAERRREGFQHDKALRDEAFRYEEAVRREALQRGESEKINDRRIDFWDRLAPKLGRLDKIIDQVLGSGSGIDDVETIFRESDELFSLYRPYFSTTFEDEYENYKDKLRIFVDMAAKAKGNMLGHAEIDGLLIACNRYLVFRDGAAIEIAQSIGLARNGSVIPKAPHHRTAECDRRVNRAYERRKQGRSGSPGDEEPAPVEAAPA